MTLQTHTLRLRDRKETIEKIECIMINNFFLSRDYFCENKKTYQKLEENI